MSIGERLKTEREKKGISIDEIHSQLRIHPEIIRNLEDNKFEALPAAIYTRGFLKRYSEFLALNAQELVTEYEALHIPQKKQSFVIESDKGPATSSLFPDLATRGAKGPGIKAGPIVKLLILALAGLVVLYAGIKIVDAMSSRPAKSRAPSPQSAQIQQPVDNKTREKAIAQVRKNSPYLYTVAQGNYPKILPAEPIMLELRAHSAVWLRLAGDGDIVFESIMQAGQQKSWAANKAFDLQLGRPEGVSLSINGNDLGVMPDPTAKHVSISRKGIRRL